MIPERKKKLVGQPIASLMRAALDPAIAKIGLSQASLMLDWDTIMGARIAAMCEPEKLRRPRGSSKTAPEAATLILRVANGFGLDVQHMAPTIIERVNTHLGWRCVGAISIKSAPLKHIGRRRAVKDKPAPVPLSPLIEAQISAFKDEALRNALGRLGTAIGRTRRTTS